MSTEIKAKGDELIERFDNIDIGDEFSTSYMTRSAAIECSITMVEFLIKESNRTEKPITYWRDVLNYLKSKL